MTPPDGARPRAIPEPRWLDAEEQAAWRSYTDVATPLAHALEVDLLPFGLTGGDYEVLVHLSEAEGRRMRMCDLAARLRLSPSGLTRRLDGLVRHGLVAREPSPDDRRVMLAALTDVGYDLLVEAAPHHVESVRRHFVDVLTRAEIRALASAFVKIRRSLEAQVGSDCTEAAGAA